MPEATSKTSSSVPATDRALRIHSAPLLSVIAMNTNPKRILAAAERYDVEVSEASWRDLAKGGKDS